MRQWRQFLRIFGFRVPSMSSSNPIHNEPKSPYNATPKNVPLEKLMPGSICAHNGHSHQRHESAGHNIHTVDEAEQRGWHNGQRSCSIFPDDPINFLSSFQQDKYDVVRGFGTADHCRSINALE